MAAPTNPVIALVREWVEKAENDLTAQTLVTQVGGRGADPLAGLK